MKMIVLIEDDEAIRDVFNLSLRAWFKVVVFENSELILSNKADVPDVFVLDKNISGISGIDLCRFIKSSERYKHVPTYLLSAAPDIANAAQAAGADGFIEKPFSIKSLRELMLKAGSC